MKKKILFLVPILVAFFCVNNVSAYVVIENTGSQGQDRPVESKDAIQNPTTMYYNGLTNMGTSPWLYSIGQYWYQGNTAGNIMNINADYSVRIDIPQDGTLGYTNYLVNASRNTLTEENLRCAIDGLGTGYQGNYAPEITGFKVNFTENAVGATARSFLIRIRFNYRQQLPYVYTGGHNMSCWFERIPSNGLFGQITGGATANSVSTWYWNNRFDVVVSEDQLTAGLNGIQSAIDGTNDKIDETNDKLDDMINADADASVNPDDSKYNDYEDAEGDLKDKVSEADLSNISIGIDNKSSSWIWNTLTSLLQSHSVIFGMVIAILSVGIIKLALGR